MDIKRRSQKSQTPDVPYATRKWRWSEKVKDRSLYVFAGIKKKLSAFKQRKEKQGSGMSKKEVNRYLKKQQKEAQAPINNAFAEAFSKIKL